ncbi:MAG: hypothetical protein RLY86_1461 [Pseudomonadota bacterium]|jgi:hypothetical protein
MADRPLPLVCPPLAVRVRGIADARAALAVAREMAATDAPCDAVWLIADAGAAALAGPAWWAALVDALTAEFPDIPFIPVLDCGSAAGAVLASVREGCRHVAFSGREDVWDRLASIIRAAGGQLYRPGDLPPAANLRWARDRVARLRAIVAETRQTGGM